METIACDGQNNDLENNCFTKSLHANRVMDEMTRKCSYKEYMVLFVKFEHFPAHHFYVINQER